MKEFNRIELAFLVPGHTYMPCDRKFGTVSRALKKFETISSPDVLCTHLRNAENPHLNLQKLTREVILNINILT